MEKMPYAWIFFLLFILIATFIVINLFIAVIVDSLNNLENDSAEIQKEEKDIHREVSALREQVAQQNQDLRELKTMLQEQLTRSK
jgi:voltage-gated sodium channel